MNPFLQVRGNFGRGWHQKGNLFWNFSQTLMQLLTLETRDNLVKMAKPESRVNLEIKDRLEDLEGTDKMA